MSPLCTCVIRSMGNALHAGLVCGFQRLQWICVTSLDKLLSISLQSALRHGPLPSEPSWTLHASNLDPVLTWRLKLTGSKSTGSKLAGSKLTAFKLKESKLAGSKLKHVLKSACTSWPKTLPIPSDNYLLVIALTTVRYWHFYCKEYRCNGGNIGLFLVLHYYHVWLVGSFWARQTVWMTCLAFSSGRKSEARWRGAVVLSHMQYVT